MQPSQPAEELPPAEELLAVAAEVTPAWLRRITIQAATIGGFEADRFEASLESMIEAESARLVQQLTDLLATDVDQQRTNPLALYRAAVAAPTELLRSIGVPPPPADVFIAERFPNDVYQLGPASFGDIDPRLSQPGLVWGAWKAMTVLHRRRDEGLR